MATEQRKIEDVKINESLMVHGGASMQVTAIRIDSRLGEVVFTLTNHVHGDVGMVLDIGTIVHVHL